MADTNSKSRLSDGEIIALFNARSEDAVRACEKQYGTYLMGIAVSILGNEQDAEECVNDAYLKAWKSIPPEDPPSLRVYLARLCRHLSIDRYRTLKRHKRDRDMTVTLDELDEVAPAEDAQNELALLLEDFLRSLEPAERNLFVGRYWHNYPPDVLAAHCGISRNAVVLRLMRTRQKLKKYLTERGYTV